MSDPFQVVAAVGGCVDVGIRLYTALGTLAKETSSADSTVAAIRNKVTELTELLKSVQKTYKLRINTGLDDHEVDIWKTIRACLERCEATLRRYEEEVTGLMDPRSRSWLERTRLAMSIQRSDHNMSRLESGIHIHLMAMQINFCNLQVHTNITVVNKLEQILSAGVELLNTPAVMPWHSRARRGTVPLFGAESMEQSTPGPSAALGDEEMMDRELLCDAVRLGQDVVRTQRDGEPVLRIDSGVDVGPGVNDQVEALAEAAKHGHFDTVIQSAREGHGFNSQTSDGVTLLMYAARHDNFPALEELLRAKAAVNSRDQRGWSALHYAAKYARDGLIVERLIDKGLDVNDVSKPSGETPFLMASKAYPTSKAVMDALVGRKAKVNQANEKGHTALSMAVESNDYLRVRFLVEQCGAVYPPDKRPPVRTKQDIISKIQPPKRRASAAY